MGVSVPQPERAPPGAGCWNRTAAPRVDGAAVLGNPVRLRNGPRHCEQGKPVHAASRGEPLGASAWEGGPGAGRPVTCEPGDRPRHALHPSTRCGKRRHGDELRRGRAVAPGRRETVSSFPFTAIVGMDDLRLALILNAVSPQIGGVLVRGEKGTAKSTAVRALAAVLPAVAVVPGCRFSCSPVVARSRLPGRPACVGRLARGPRRPRRGVARRGQRGSPDRIAGPGARPDRRCEVLRARTARCRAPRGALRRRGQSAARPPGRPAPGRRGARHQLRRAGRGVGAARRPVPARRHDEPRGGGAAPAVARPVRGHRRGGGAEGPRSAGRGRPPPAGLRRGAGRCRRRLRRRRARARRRLSPPPAASCRMSSSTTRRCAASPRCARRSVSTACGRTS